MVLAVNDGEHRAFDDLVVVSVLANADDPVYAATPGWMLVGDQRLTMMPGWADLRPTARLELVSAADSDLTTECTLHAAALLFSLPCSGPV